MRDLKKLIHKERPIIIVDKLELWKNISNLKVTNDFGDTDIEGNRYRFFFYMKLTVNRQKSYRKNENKK